MPLDHCIDCSRPLKSKISKDRGRGPVCYRKAHPPRIKASEPEATAFDPNQRFLPFANPVPGDIMRNLRMQEKIKKGEAVDLSNCNRTPAGDYILPSFRDGLDYCDAKEEAWIWSIGRNLKTGQILASTLGKFYQNPEFECLWLR